MLEALGQRPFPAIPPVDLARHRIGTDHGVDLRRSDLPAWPVVAVGMAHLSAFGRIDADQPHPLARYLECVCVEHGRLPVDHLALAARCPYADAG
jgi:hypothetical protein